MERWCGAGRHGDARRGGCGHSRRLRRRSSPRSQCGERRATTAPTPAHPSARAIWCARRRRSRARPYHRPCARREPEHRGRRVPGALSLVRVPRPTRRAPSRRGAYSPARVHAQRSVDSRCVARRHKCVSTSGRGVGGTVVSGPSVVRLRVGCTVGGGSVRARWVCVDVWQGSGGVSFLAAWM